MDGRRSPSLLKRLGVVLAIVGTIVGVLVAVAPASPQRIVQASPQLLTTSSIIIDPSLTSIVLPPPPPICCTSIIIDPSLTSIVLPPPPPICCTSIIIDPTLATIALPPPPVTPPPVSTTIVIDPGTPPPPPPVVEKVPLTVSVQGKGTVRSTDGAIDCPSKCSAEYDPGAQVMLTANGNLKSSGGACAGIIGNACAFNMNGATGASFVFADEGAFTPPPLDLHRVIFEVRWAASAFHGSLLLQGSVQSAQELLIHLSRLGRAPQSASSEGALVKTITVRVGAGSFNKRVKLPADLLPGRYSVKVTSKVGKLNQKGIITLLAPSEGVVAKAGISGTENGKPATKLTGASALFVRFVLAALPVANLPLTVTWIGPDGQPVGAPVPKPSTATVTSFVQSGGPLPTGSWKVVLRAGPKVVKTLSVLLA